MNRKLFVGLIVIWLLAMVVWGYSQIGGDDAGDSGNSARRNGSSSSPISLQEGALDADIDDSVGGQDTPVPSPSVDTMPGPPIGLPAPAATLGPTDGPEPGAPEPGADAAAASPAAAGAAGEPEWGEPPPEPAPVAEPGTLVHDVQLTIYSCYGDSTGAYCPWGNSMYCGKQVYRGAAACGWQWPCGQRFRIVGDPYDMIYTCEDRGGAVIGIDIYFEDYYAPETQAWRNAMDGHVTVELVD